MLHHLEKHLDVPPLAINSDDLLIGKINLGGQDRQPLTFLAVTALQRAGFDVFSVITGLGIGGVAVAFAAQETLANVLGALQIMTDQPFAVGDVIRVEADVGGKVERIGLRSTRLLTTSGVRIVVPNRRIAAAAVQNHTHPEGLVRDVTLQLDPRLSAEKLREAVEIVREVLLAEPRVSDVFAVNVSAFAEWSTNVRVVFYVVKLDDSSAATGDVLLAIRARMDAAGVALAVVPSVAVVPKA